MINSKQSRLQIWMPLWLSLAMIGGIFIGYKMRDGIPGKPFFHTERRAPVQEVLDLVRNKYVDQVNLESLSDTAINAILAKLDPHSTFISASELEEVNEDIQGSFFGIGIEFDLFDDTVNVMRLLPDGPASKAGLQPGDRILKADERKLSGVKLPSDTIRKILRGEKGSSLTLNILRQNQPKSITVTRNMIPVNSVDAAYMLSRETGYLRLNKFSTQTYREFMIALTELNKKGMKKMILDLRGNGGGILDEAAEIADEFLAGDKLITYTEGLHSKRKEFRCRRVGQFETGALVLLCDEGTASASEILLGALQDWDRATIIGRKSFGKGLVQEQYDLQDNSALRLTVARYYTPTGRSIQRTYKNGQKAYYEEMENRMLNGSFASDSAKKDSGRVFLTPEGKKVYAEGGISPDEYIPADTSRISPTMREFYLRGLFNRYAYIYLQQNPDFDSRYQNQSSFNSSFMMTPADWTNLSALAAKDSIKNQVLTDAERVIAEKAVKASIARLRWENLGFYEVMNLKDPYILAAQETLNGQ
jgi:carboxyl-terminal processing protease